MATRCGPEGVRSLARAVYLLGINIYIYVCIYMYIGMSIFLFVFIHICVYVCVCACVWTDMHVLESSEKQGMFSIEMLAEVYISLTHTS